MDTFTEQEGAYLAEPRLGRLATVDGRGRPHVVPTGFRFDPGEGDPEELRRSIRCAG